MAKLKLAKPICFFDLETTGTQVATDRIVEIAILKIMPNGEELNKTWRVNPGVPIPAEASAVHGISNEDVQDCPTFEKLAPEINDWIKDADLAGYNSHRFDIPLLAEEFLRVGIDFDMSTRKAIDVQMVFYRKEPRTLTAAYKYYCDKDLDGAHSADADTRATYEVLLAQLDKYDDLEADINFLEEFTKPSAPNADLAGFIKFNEQGKEEFGFGKYKGKLVEQVLEQNPGYYSWIQNADFPLYTKKVLTRIKLRNFNKA